jgi:hypothetical protein
MSSEHSTTPFTDRDSITAKAQQTSAVAASSNTDGRKKEMIERLAQHYEIRPELANRIHVLEDYELVILCDDSGSMNIPIHGTTTTRWDECRQLVHIVTDVYAAFDSNGLDLYFLK